MQIVKMILVIMQFILCIAVTILAMMQSKDDAGLSATITGSSTNNFFEKNKSRTREGQLKRWTIIHLKSNFKFRNFASKYLNLTNCPPQIKFD